MGFFAGTGVGRDLVVSASRPLIAIVLALAFAGWSGAGAAQGLSQTVYADQNQSLSLPIQVAASVGGRCEFSGLGPNGTYNAGAIDSTAWINDFLFQLSCNTASRVAVVSSNGGLKAAATINDEGYVGIAPYTVELNLDGNSSTVNASCAVATLSASAAQPCSFRGPASSSTGLRLTGPSQNRTGTYLRVSAPAYSYSGSAVLVAGNYADTLTITIAAAP